VLAAAAQVGMGMGEWSEDKVKTDYNLVNPPLRDTTTGELHNLRCLLVVCVGAKYQPRMRRRNAAGKATLLITLAEIAPL
jgi:hypothetical protein